MTQVLPGNTRMISMIEEAMKLAMVDAADMLPEGDEKDHRVNAAGHIVAAALTLLYNELGGDNSIRGVVHAVGLGVAPILAQSYCCPGHLMAQAAAIASAIIDTTPRVAAQLGLGEARH